MNYPFFLIVISVFTITTAQQHDPHVLLAHLSQDLALKSWEYLEKTWEDYKKERPGLTNTLGDCLEFDIYVIEKYKDADEAYTQFEARAVPPPLSYEYAKTRYELENTKNVANYAVLLSSQLRALLFKKKCEPKDKPADR